MLADEMGMGKSLSMISLLMRTLDRARRWAVSEAQQEAKEGSQGAVSRATLIIVPSAREFHLCLPKGP